MDPDIDDSPFALAEVISEHNRSATLKTIALAAISPLFWVAAYAFGYAVGFIFHDDGGPWGGALFVAALLVDAVRYRGEIIDLERFGRSYFREGTSQLTTEARIRLYMQLRGVPNVPAAGHVLAGCFLLGPRSIVMAAQAWRSRITADANIVDEAEALALELTEKTWVSVDSLTSRVEAVEVLDRLGFLRLRVRDGEGQLRIPPSIVDRFIV